MQFLLHGCIQQVIVKNQTAYFCSFCDKFVIKIVEIDYDTLGTESYKLEFCGATELFATKCVVRVQSLYRQEH